MQATGAIVAHRALVDGTLAGPVTVQLCRDRIARVDHGEDVPGVPATHLPSGVLTSGLVDLQLNGAFGIDCASADSGEWVTLSRRLTEKGVTSFQAAFVSAAPEALTASLEAAATARPLCAEGGGARMIGVHLEGPFLAPARAGAHDRSALRLPDRVLVDELLDVEPGLVTMMTLAPELPGALPLIEHLMARGVSVALGHSAATDDEVVAAVDAGARVVTHLFNAQEPMRAREPGLSGIALTDERLTVCLIADLVHVAPAMCALAFAAAPGRVALVSDAVAPAGLGPGAFRAGPSTMTVGDADPVARLADGTIAGALTLLDGCVRNLTGIGIEARAVLAAATITPASAAGTDGAVGAAASGAAGLCPGAPADMVWWDDDLVPEAVWIGGRRVLQ